MKTRLYRVFISWDIWMAFILGLSSFFLFPPELPYVLAKDIFLMAISILAIIFSIFFAALAVLITAGDNEFVIFLQENSSYTEIIWGYKYSLFVIFLGLIVSIFLFISTSFQGILLVPGIYPNWIIAPFIFLTSYSLFCTFTAAIAAIQYAELRTKYLKRLKEIRDQEKLSIELKQTHGKNRRQRNPN